MTHSFPSLVFRQSPNRSDILGSVGAHDFSQIQPLFTFAFFSLILINYCAVRYSHKFNTLEMAVTETVSVLRIKLEPMKILVLCQDLVQIKMRNFPSS